jgi:hypothetical protein
MLNGIDPIVIFQFSKLAPSTGEALAKIPLVSQLKTLIDLPPIPVYLSRELTGIVIDSEDKVIDIETTTETKTDGSDPDVNQKAIQSVVSINITGLKTSIGLSLLSALMDVLYEKASSKEYSLTYLNGPTTIFRGKVHSYTVNQNSQDERLTIKIDISKGEKQPQKQSTVPETKKVSGTTPLDPVTQ